MQNLLIALAFVFSSAILAQTEEKNQIIEGNTVKVSVVNALNALNDNGTVAFAFYNKERFMKAPLFSISSTIVNGISTVIFENIPEGISLELVSPAYNRENTEGHTSQSRNDLNQLEYPQGEIIKGDNSYTYNQNGWGEFSYQIHTSWEETEEELSGCWSVSSANEGWEPTPKASEVVSVDTEIGYKSAHKTHMNWWRNYWSQSAVEIPDSLLQ